MCKQFQKAHGGQDVLPCANGKGPGMSCTTRVLKTWAQMKCVSHSVVSTLCDPMDCSPPGSPVRGILQARILEWVAISFSRGSSWPRDWIQVSCIAGRHFNLWATREAELRWNMCKNEKERICFSFFLLSSIIPLSSPSLGLNPWS